VPATGLEPLTAKLISLNETVETGNDEVHHSSLICLVNELAHGLAVPEHSPGPERSGAFGCLAMCCVLAISDGQWRQGQAKHIENHLGAHRERNCTRDALPQPRLLSETNYSWAAALPIEAAAAVVLSRWCTVVSLEVECYASSLGFASPRRVAVTSQITATRRRTSGSQLRRLRPSRARSQPAAAADDDPQPPGAAAAAC